MPFSPEAVSSGAKSQDRPHLYDRPSSRPYLFHNYCRTTRGFIDPSLSYGLLARVPPAAATFRPVPLHQERKRSRFGAIA